MSEEYHVLSTPTYTNGFCVQVVVERPSEALVTLHPTHGGVMEVSLPNPTERARLIRELTTDNGYTCMSSFQSQRNGHTEYISTYLRPYNWEDVPERAALREPAPEFLTTVEFQPLVLHDSRPRPEFEELSLYG
jgi:hypothetical protein